jgi:pimeloyl-ACP methyl ester carboxylesterase
MKKFLSGLALTGILSLAGCGGDGPAEPVVPEQKSLTHPVFDPINGVLPIPNDILFSGTADLTLNIPNGMESNPGDLIGQINRLDGWSSVAPFIVEFTDAIDPSSVSGNIRVFKVSTYRQTIEPVPGMQTITPTGPVVGIEKELSAAEIHVAAVSSTQVRLTPLVPLEPQAAYMVVVTDGVKDSNGLALTATAQYETSKSTSTLVGTSFEALEGLRVLVNYMVAAGEAAGIPAANNVLSFQFTTQSVYEVMSVVKQVADGTILQTMAAHPAGINAIIALQNTGMNTSMVNPALPGLGQIYVGQLNLPYYLTAASSPEDPSALFGSWKGQQGSNLTYFNKLPVATDTESVPVLLTMPSLNPATGGAFTKPDAGWPVVIFQHGITRNRTDMFAVADFFASQGYAVIAIDQPMHGLVDSTNPLFTGFAKDDVNGPIRERTFGVDYVTINEAGISLGADGSADPSGLHYMNLQSLSNFRDNFRQSAADLLFFAKAVSLADFDGVPGADFDSSRIHYLGDSLGGIAGANFLGYDDVVQSAALAYPGGGLTGFLKASAYVGGQLNPLIKAAAVAQGIDPDSAAYVAFYEQFIFAATTISDSGDPVLNAGMLKNSPIPLVIMQVPNDDIVPNNGFAVGQPLTGTEPLAAALMLDSVTAADLDANAIIRGGDAVRAFVKYNTGEHGNLVNPAADAAVRTSMQTGALSLFASGGMQFMLTDTTIIDID